MESSKQITVLQQPIPSSETYKGYSIKLFTNLKSNNWPSVNSNIWAISKDIRIEFLYTYLFWKKIAVVHKELLKSGPTASKNLFSHSMQTLESRLSRLVHASNVQISSSHEIKLQKKIMFTFYKLSSAQVVHNSYFYIKKWTFKIMCEVCYRAKRDKKEATWF